MPVAQVVVRRLKNAALTGDGIAIRRLLSMTDAAEQRETTHEDRKIVTLANYKQQWEHEFQRCRYEGEPIPDPVPHPDDIVIDSRTGEIFINGPGDDVEKAEWDRADCERRKAEAAIENYERYRNDPERDCAVYWIDKSIKDETEKLAKINRKYPSAEERRQPGFNLKRHRAGKQVRAKPEPKKKTRPRPRSSD